MRSRPLPVSRRGPVNEHALKILLSLFLTAIACVGSEVHANRIEAHLDNTRVDSLGRDTVSRLGVGTQSAGPVVEKPRVSFVADTFGVVRGICVAGSLVAVLDAGMDPHVSLYTSRGSHVWRTLPHTSSALGVVQGDALACRETQNGVQISVLDRHARRIINLAFAEGRGFSNEVRVIDLSRILAASDQPMSVATTTTGIALGGVFESGARFLWSSNDSVWSSVGRESSSAKSDGSSFLPRIIEGTRVVGDVTSGRVIATGNYVPLIWRMEEPVAPIRVDRWGLGSRSNLGIKRGADSSWRLHWSSETLLRATALASAADAFAILDCNCSPSTPEMTESKVILGHFSNENLESLRISGRPVAIALSADGRTLIGAVGPKGNQRIVEWMIP